MALLSGKDVAAALKEQLKKDVGALKSKGINPTLGIVRMGEERGDLAYENGVKKSAEEVGIALKVFVLSREASQDELIKTIGQVNGDASVHGVLLFQPLPKPARAALDPKKDMDGITEGSMAGIYCDEDKGYPPCTAESVIKIIKHYNIELQGKNVVVIGRSTVIGKPVSMLLLKENATITICHSKTKDLAKRAQEADVVVVAMGRAWSVDKSYFRAGQYVIDVGVNSRPDGEKGTCGDVKTEEVEPIVAGITPVPGGVGTVTNTTLLCHVVEAASKK